MSENTLTRRNFIHKATAGLAAGAALGVKQSSAQNVPPPLEKKLPRQVWIAAISQDGLSAQNPKSMVLNVADILKEVSRYHPDIICLPETFAHTNVSDELDVKKAADELAGLITREMSGFARENQCYLICPVYTRDGEQVYNSAVVLDREGDFVGGYHKTHPTESEIEKGITPGPLDPPVFKTDFGKIGVQICFDIQWGLGWYQLEKTGADIVFWPSAFAGGRLVNTKAWQHKYVTVSSTKKDTTKICDISGKVIASTNRWHPNFVVAPVNLEKAFLHTWPYVRKFEDIRRKYGRHVSITTFGEEEFTILESRHPSIRVADILEEYNIKTHREHIESAERAQNRARPG